MTKPHTPMPLQPKGLQGGRIYKLPIVRPMAALLVVVVVGVGVGVGVVGVGVVVAVAVSSK